MYTVIGYQVLKQLHDSANSNVFRAIRLADTKPVILKILKDRYPTPEQVARFQREYEITRSIISDGVVQVYALETQQHHPVMVLEDFGGNSLLYYIEYHPLDISTILTMAVPLTDTLGHIHHHRIIHKDINPSNIVYNVTTGCVKFIDFGISTVLLHEKQLFRNPNALEGTLAYISPEQTGRMNRDIDYRTDFYSLGATFYELLTLQLPFNSNDPLELVHSHIARQPVPPHHINPAIPEPLSAIILKLLAKNAEDRYQSAYGLKADFEAVREMVVGKTTQHFIPGHYDITDHLLLPQKLYGREQEVGTLLATFEQVCHGSRALVLVTGAAGIGKSSLVQEVHKPITQQRGYFIAGKFEQFQRNVPYSALIQAFQTLIHHLLAESETALAHWRTHITTALGTNGQIMIELIPVLEVIIGEQPEPPELGPAEAHHRFQLVFQQFVYAFARPEHPLVLFIDDLQWADSSSLSIIERLLTNVPDEHMAAPLLIVGAYRSNEVEADHPMSLTVQALHDANVPIQTITLTPLNAHSVTHIIADTLHATPDDVQPLSDLLVTKTGGNPFFLGEFLKSLAQAQLLSFNYEQGHWQWNIANIQAQRMTDNVVDLMVNRIQQLSVATQQLLKYAACIGNQFSLAMLAHVSDMPFTHVAQLLDEVLTAGLVVPQSSNYYLMTLDVPGLQDYVTTSYAFAHDRIQQATYVLIAEDERQTMHWHIGMLLLQQTLATTQHLGVTLDTILANPYLLTTLLDADTHIFDLATHLNHMPTEEATCQVCDMVATINLMAGKKATSAVAYAPAYNYLQHGMQLLFCTKYSDVQRVLCHCPWERCYDVTLALMEETAEAAYLNGAFDETTHLATEVISHARTLLDTVRVHQVTIVAAMAQNRLLDAVHTALDVLSTLGIVLPTEPTADDFMQGLQDVTTAIGDTPIETVSTMADITDPIILAAMRILVSVTSAAYLASPILSALITFKQVVLSLTYGNAAMSPFAYGMYGFILCGVLGDVEQGYRYGAMALTLAQHPRSREFRASTTHVVNAGVMHWKDPIQQAIPALLQAYKIGLETGDVQYAANAVYMHCVTSFIAGVSLSDMAQERASFSRTLTQLKQHAALAYHEIYRQVIANLIEEPTGDEPTGDKPEQAAPWLLCGKYYDETVSLPEQQAAGDQTGVHLVYVHKMMLAYLFEAYDEALLYAPLAEETVAGVTSSPQVPFFYFYDSLTRLAIAGKAIAQHYATVDVPLPPLAIEQFEKVAANQQKMEQWAMNAPVNYHHKWYLVAAELARLQNNDGIAWEYYHRAIGITLEHGLLHEHALAYELTARFYRHKGMLEVADIYIAKSCYAYQCWGAHAKVRVLQKRYVFLNDDYLSSSSTTNPRVTVNLDSSKTMHSSDIRKTYTLDLSSVIKASQALSGEIVLDALLSRLMNTMLENAGAERGVLLLNQNDTWFVEAQSDIESNTTTVLQSIPMERAEVPFTIINYVAHTRQSVVLADATHEEQFAYDTYITSHKPRSILCIPLVHQGKLTAILYMENNQSTGAFTTNRLEILNLLYGQVAISLENARLYTHVQSNEKKYRRLFEESKDTIFITTPDGQLLDMNPAGLALFGYCSEEAIGATICTLLASPDEWQRIMQHITTQNTGSIRNYEITLYRKDGVAVECLLSATLSREEAGKPESLHGMLRDVTAQRRAERERLQLSAMQRELSIARDIQHSLLPYPHPQWHRPQVRCYNNPAREVGGDLYAYHAFVHDDGKEQYGIAVGDVSGKGVPAALLMAVSMASFRSLIEQGFAPSAFLERMDHAITQHTHNTRQNCAMVYTDITYDKGLTTTCYLRVANAGCILPIVKRRDGSVEWVETGGMPLGIQMNPKYPYLEVALTLEAGDCVLLMSDGVIEANNATNDMYGFERLEEVVRSAPREATAETMLAHVQHDLEVFVGDTEQHDDITLVVIQV